MSQLSIQILHQDYLLTCPDGQEAQLREAVERVDQQFQVMRENSKLRSRERIGVLLAVNLAYENLELRKQLQALQQQVVALQDSQEPALTDADIERLQALESQAAQDQAIASALIERLDAVLGQDQPTEAETAAGTAVAEIVEPAADLVTMTEAPHTADIANEGTLEELPSSTNSHSEMNVGLHAVAEESL